MCSTCAWLVPDLCPTCAWLALGLFPGFWLHRWRAPIGWWRTCACSASRPSGGLTRGMAWSCAWCTSWASPPQHCCCCGGTGPRCSAQTVQKRPSATGSSMTGTATNLVCSALGCSTLFLQWPVLLPQLHIFSGVVNVFPSQLWSDSVGMGDGGTCGECDLDTAWDSIVEDLGWHWELPAEYFLDGCLSERPQRIAPADP